MTSLTLKSKFSLFLKLLQISLFTGDQSVLGADSVVKNETKKGPASSQYILLGGNRPQISKYILSSVGSKARS